MIDLNHEGYLRVSGSSCFGSLDYRCHKIHFDAVAFALKTSQPYRHAFGHIHNGCLHVRQFISVIVPGVDLCGVQGVDLMIILV
jgi:hypothetical protein